MKRHTNTPESAQAILREILKNKPAVLKIQRELIDEGKDIGKTGAGAVLNQEIRELVGKHQKEVKELEWNMRKAIEEKDEESREELEEEKKKVEESMEKLQKDSAEMQSKFEQAQREMGERINVGVEGRLVRIREAYEAKIWKYQERVRELENDGPENAEEIEFLKKVIEYLRKKLAAIIKMIEYLGKGIAGSCIIM